MKKISLLCIIALSIVPNVFMYAQSAKYWVIKGMLAGNNGKQQVHLYYSLNKKIKDSAKIVNGAFELKGTLDEAVKAHLSLRNPEVAGEKGFTYVTVYLEPGYTITVKGRNDLGNVTISGGPVQKDLSVLERMKEPVQNKMNRNSLNYQKTANPDSLAYYSSKDKGLRKEITKTEDLFIKNHPRSVVSWDIVNERSWIILDPVMVENAFNMLDFSYKNSAKGKAIAEKIATAKYLVIGKPALDFSLNDTTGKAVTLSSFKGKYLLVDFWASWCGPCRAENPNVLKAYNQFKDKNFEVVGVSLDATRNLWVRAINEDRMPWRQLSDLKGWESVVAKQYGIQVIPQNFLLDPDGIIVAKNLRGEQLIATISQVMTSKKSNR